MAIPQHLIYSVGGVAPGPSTILQADSSQTLTVPPGQAFRIHKFTATVAGVISSAPTLRIYLNSFLASDAVAATDDARRWSSEPHQDIYIRTGEKIIALWDQIPADGFGDLYVLTMLGEFVSNS